MAALRQRGWPVRRTMLNAAMWLTAAGMASGCKDAPLPATGTTGSGATAAATAGSAPSTLERVVAACVEAMVRSTCQVMAGSSASSTASVIFVAGVGPVDAAAYRKLRESGEGMCEVVRAACKADWDSAQCKASRALWPGATRG